MARIAGVDLPRDKRIEIGLTYIFGIGLTRSHEILAATGVNPDIRVRDLGDQDVAALRNAVAGYQVEGDLRRWESMNVKRLMDIGSYRGRRSPGLGYPFEVSGLARIAGPGGGVPRELLLARKKSLARSNSLNFSYFILDSVGLKDY